LTKLKVTGKICMVNIGRIISSIFTKLGYNRK